jgi:shikimate kinase
MSVATADNVYLVGPMGSGKTAVGKRLAQALQLHFYDSDDVVEAVTGVDIPYIFEKEGEEGFRKRESAVIEELTALSGIILASGGGVATNEINRNRLSANGTVIYLYTSVAEQLRRTRKSFNRPLLNVEDPARVLEELMQIRDPQYRKIADYVIETDGRQVAVVAKEIIRKLTAD